MASAIAILNILSSDSVDNEGFDAHLKAVGNEVAASGGRIPHYPHYGTGKARPSGVVQVISSYGSTRAVCTSSVKVACGPKACSCVTARSAQVGEVASQRVRWGLKRGCAVANLREVQVLANSTDCRGPAHSGRGLHYATAASRPGSLVLIRKLAALKFRISAGS